MSISGAKIGHSLLKTVVSMEQLLLMMSSSYLRYNFHTRGDITCSHRGNIVMLVGDAMTLECVEDCAEGQTMRSDYCYDVSEPEPKCVVR